MSEEYVVYLPWFPGFYTGESEYEPIRRFVDNVDYARIFSSKFEAFDHIADMYEKPWEFEFLSLSDAVARDHREYQSINREML